MRTLKTILKIIAVLICLLAVVGLFGRYGAEGKTIWHTKTIEFSVPDTDYAILYNDKKHIQSTFHYSALRDSIKLAEIYFKGLDPEFSFDNYEITIRVVDHLSNNLFGYFDWDIIRVQTFDHMQGNGYKLFGQVPSYKEYVALIVHEIAHSILYQRSAYIDSGGHEYFAYCVMFDIARKDLVQRASKLYKIWTGFEELDQINIHYHDMTPGQFAIRSYYYREQDDWEVFYQIWNGWFKSYVPPGMQD